MSLADGMLQELEQEAQTTRRLLERVPDDRLTWRPHSKSRTLGELALHVATVPGGVAEFVSQPSPVQAPQFIDPSPRAASELLPALDESIAKAKKILGEMDDTALLETWRIMNGDREIFAIPRIGFVRSIMLNHWYHHRGQLSVYLRELDIPIPSIYGPTCRRESVRLESRCARRGRDAVWAFVLIPFYSLRSLPHCPLQRADDVIYSPVGKYV